MVILWKIPGCALLHTSPQSVFSQCWVHRCGAAASTCPAQQSSPVIARDGSALCLNTGWRVSVSMPLSTSPLWTRKCDDWLLGSCHSSKVYLPISVCMLHLQETLIYGSQIKTKENIEFEIIVIITLLLLVTSKYYFCHTELNIALDNNSTYLLWKSGKEQFYSQTTSCKYG